MKLQHALLCLVTLLLTPLAPCYAVNYTITDLGTIAGYSAQTVPLRINSSGQVTGYASTSGFNPRAFLYSNGAIQDLGTLGGTKSYGAGINDAGQVTGYSYIEVDGHDVLQAFLYDGVSMQALTPVPGDPGNGEAINNLGQVVLQSGPLKNVFLYSGGAFTDLGKLGWTGAFRPIPRDINDAGQIVGVIDQVTHAFLYSGGLIQDLGSLGGSTSEANANNNLGVVVGKSDRSVGPAHAFLYDGTMHDLGSLGDGLSSAADVNLFNQVVGLSVVSGVNHAFLYSGGAMIDLNTLLGPNSGWFLNSANAINDRGQIAGVGIFNGQSRGFLMTPVPEPGAIVLAAIGGAATVTATRCRRRK